MADEYPKALYNPASGDGSDPESVLWVRNERAEAHWTATGLKPLSKAKAADLEKKEQ